MSWTDYFADKIYGGAVLMSADGRTYFSKKLDNNETVEIFFNAEVDTPFDVWFRRRIGNEITDERLYGRAGTRRLAYQIAKYVIDLRVLSEEFIFDGE